ncbi:MAG: bifunctional phosphoribosylaminoimidazolecarboxamide formyltransferase/IMP cyclohydrolase [Kiritimatiellae bacterium]|nr:bifunctional phosphoribosylaminoimidazolecarboxamide formyltransferase/IMP cyclohydrolase [Kiritimatiellia bacterium]MDW8459067.1 bifunctional phosphoribosylaminoimidazolecarboxamide formyltransferase/IMP cyclohydrolase [Verrucomicrobiota bacterium]
MKIQRALISVSDKSGILDFAAGLAEFGIELLSTGGTARLLQSAGLPVRDVSEFTGFPEMLGGRLKTLHPKVHAGLLYLRGDIEHERTMQKHGFLPIDLVAVNLYPFEATASKPDISFDAAIEQIDIGGPTMLRSAAKNHAFVTVVTDPADYARVLAEMKQRGGSTSHELRRELAFKVFAQQARYDAAIAAFLAKSIEPRTVPPFVLAFTAGERLRYGENPHQEAIVYREPAVDEACAAHCTLLHGKEMSYNNYLDADAALEAVRELAGRHGVAIVKHTNPCGYATGATLAEAFEAAWAGDPVSAFGSVVAVSSRVDLATAQCTANRFIEVLIAPNYDSDALEFLKAKSRSLRLLQLNAPLAIAKSGASIRQINGGLLVQDRDVESIAQWMVPTAAFFPEEKKALAEFGIKVCKHIKSNAIAIVREYTPGQFMLLGMGAGQPNRVDALRKLALPRAEENIHALYESQRLYGTTLKEFRDQIIRECVLISDAFFPFPDAIEHAAEAGIRYIVQPGGSRKDEEIIAACDRYGIAMAFTGMRHFKH